MKNFILILVAVLLALLLLKFSFKWIMPYASVPFNESLSQERNLCVNYAFPNETYTIEISTHHCSDRDKKFLATIDSIKTRMCPKVKLEDKNNDGIKDVIISNNPLCKLFVIGNHRIYPRIDYSDGNEEIFYISKDGKISK